MRSVRRLAALLLVSLLLLVVGCQQKAQKPAVSPTTSPTASSTTSASNFVMGTGIYPDNDPPVPAKAARFSDPSFSTPLQRITDKKDGYLGPGIENEYSKMDPANSDGTLLMLRGNTAAYYLYDPVKCKLLRKVSAFDECEFTEPEPRWSRADPKLFYYICDTELRGYDTSTNESTVIHDFKKEFPTAAYVTTRSEGDASLDRRYWCCFMVEGKGDKLMGVICFDRDENQVVGHKSGGFPDSLNWVGMSMSGQWCIIGYEDKAIYTQVFSRDFQTTVKLPEGSAGHGDAALTAGGRDVYVYQNVRNDYICMADMATGAETRLVHIPFEVNPDIGMHVSGNCAATPGWALISTYGAEETPPDKTHSWMDNQLFMLELSEAPGSGGSPTRSPTRRRARPVRRIIMRRPSRRWTPAAPGCSGVRTGAISRRTIQTRTRRCCPPAGSRRCRNSSVTEGGAAVSGGSSSFF